MTVTMLKQTYGVQVCSELIMMRLMCLQAWYFLFIC